MSTILLTSGSGIFSLGLARAFHRAGHRVIVADCWEQTMSRYSAAVSAYHHVPPPALQTEAWTNAISRIADQHAVDVIVPVFEEVLYLAEACEHSPAPAELFAADFKTLVTLHNKWLFNQSARDLGLAAPESHLLTSRAELRDAFAEDPDRVFKPVYSRWASHVVVRPRTLEELEDVEPSSRQPWLAQSFLPGRPFATFSLAHNGRLTAHVTYAADMTSGHGPAFGYRPVQHPEILAWVRRFVEATNYTGQIGLDFIEDADGRISATECNPRATGALYLLSDHPQFANAFLDPEMETIGPTSSRPRVARLGLLSCLFSHSSTFPGYGVWARMFFTGRSIRVFEFRDPLPAVALPYTVGKFVWRCIKEKQDARVLATMEREWNAEPASMTASSHEPAALQTVEK